MKEMIKTLIKFSFTAAFIYAVFFSFFILKPAEIGIVKEIQTSKAVQVFGDRANFIRYGVLPWVYRVDKISDTVTSVLEVNLVIPGLSLLNNDEFFIKMPFEITYRIQKNNTLDLDFFNSRETMDRYITSIIAVSLRTVLKNYLEQGYDKLRIIRDEDNILGLLQSEVKGKLAIHGISAEKFVISGAIYYPDMDTYREALRQESELRELFFRNKKQEMQLKSSLFHEKSTNEMYYEKLTRMSALIKDNPDILKFIYIDKMAGNIKVIISSDRTGIPSLFEQEDGKSSGVSKEIDNLR